MKILIFVETFWPHLGGVEKFVETLVLGLIESGHQCCIITSSMPDLPEQDCYKGVSIFRLPLRQGLDKNITAYKYAIEKIKLIKQTFAADVYHLNTIGPIFFYHLQTLSVAKAPTVFTFHFLLNENMPLNGLLAKMLAHSDAITAGSRVTLSHCHAIFPQVQDKSHLINFGLPTSSIPRQAIDPNSQMILSWGRIVENKGFEYVLKAIAELRETFPKLIYYLIGEGPDTQRLQQIITALGLEKVVVFPQRRYGHNELFELIAACRFVINPSHDKTECFGLVALEAMQMGKMVLTTAHPGLNELVIDGITGKTFKFTDLNDLKAKITDLLQDPDELLMLSEQAHQHVNKHYQLDKMIDEYQDLYRQLQLKVDCRC